MLWHRRQRPSISAGASQPRSMQRLSGLGGGGASTLLGVGLELPLRRLPHFRHNPRAERREQGVPQIGQGCLIAFRFLSYSYRKQSPQRPDLDQSVTSLAPHLTHSFISEPFLILLPPHEGCCSRSASLPALRQSAGRRHRQSHSWHRKPPCKGCQDRNGIGSSDRI